jgi:hypothetical protein
MSKGTFLFFLGILLITLPYLGVPQTWKHYLYIGIGVLILIIGYTVRRGEFLLEIDRGNGERGGDTFIESTESLRNDVDNKRVNT